MANSEWSILTIRHSLLAIRCSSAPGAGERVHPADHARARVLDVLLAEEVLGLHLVDRIDRPQEVALVAERHGGIDAHAAFELGVRRRPLLAAGGHALGRHEGLAATASRMPCEQDSAAARKLRCQPSSIWWRFFTWMMQPPQSVMQ